MEQETRDNKSRQLPQKVALVVIFACLAGMASAMVFKGRRDSIFPPADKRYDVTETWVAAAADLCPSLDAKATLSTIEACITGLSLAPDKRATSFAKIDVPAFAELPINTFPNYADLMHDRHLDRSFNALVAKRPIIIGLRVPRRLFTPDTMGARPKVLMVSELHDAHICYLGHCPHFINLNSYLALKFPLFAPPEVEDETIDVWIVLADPVHPLAVGLESGIFVADPEDLFGVDKIHVPLLRISKLMSAVLLFGIALMALLYAALWTKFIDFAAFSGMATVLFIENIVYVIMSLQSLDQFVLADRFLVHVVSRLNVLVAAVLFAVSTLRVPPRSFWLSWLAAILATVPLTWAIGHYRPVTTMKSPFFLLTDIAAGVIPAAIIVIGGRRVQRMMAANHGVGTEIWADARRRFKGQVVLAFGVLLACVPHLLQTAQRYGGVWTYDLTALTGLALIPLFAMLLFISSNTYKSRAEAYKKNLVEMAKQAAIGEMVQMLAHDVRKPFTMLRMGMDMLVRTRSPAEMRQLVERLVPQVGKALRSVSSMLEDIMAVSSSPRMSRAPIDATVLIEQCVQDVFAARIDDAIELSYRLKHQSMLDVDAERLLRVLGNIVENAAQAMKGHGRIWFDLEDSGDGYIGLVIGNSGSYIEAAERSKIFDAFYTHGKKNGTGLGLAVSKRFVILHGGTIECRSHLEHGTEFVLRLPAHTQRADHARKDLLPSHSQQVTAPLMRVKLNLEEAVLSPLSPAETQAIEALTWYVQVANRRLVILLIDDEPIYSAALVELIPSHVASSMVAVRVATRADEAWDMARALVPDLVICDVDLGSFSINGLELCSRMQQAHLAHMLCIHSNRMLPEDEGRAIRAGAAAFLPKPMRRSQLLKLFEDTVAVLTAVKGEPGSPAQRSLAQVPTVAVIDDDIFILEAWTEALQPAKVLAFSTVENFWTWSEGGDLTQLLIVITDYHLNGPQNGVEFAIDLKKVANIPVVLATDAFESVEPNDVFQAILPKDAINLASLLALCSPMPLAKGA